MAAPRARTIRECNRAALTVTYELPNGGSDEYPIDERLPATDVMRLAKYVGAYGKTKAERLASIHAVCRGESPTVTPSTVATDAAMVVADGRSIDSPSDESALAEAIRRIASGSVDEATVRRIADASAAAAVADMRRPIQIVIPERDHTATLPETAHPVLTDVVTTILTRPNGSNGIHAMLVGPAGSGKSTIGEHAATAVGREYRSISLGPADMPTKFFGFKDATGNTVRTVVRDAYEFGHVLIIDEVDNGHPAVITALNMMLANRRCEFAGEMVDRHDDFVAIATANTHGHGADRVYLGRQALDGASLDRFVGFDVDYDETVERAMAEAASPTHGADWYDEVLRYRARAAAKRLPVIISPRATMNGAALLESGMSRNAVRKACVFFGLNQEAITTITTVGSDESVSS